MVTKAPGQPPAPAPPRPASRGPLRRLALRALAILLGLVAGLGLVEVAFRAFGVRPVRYPPPRYLVLDQGLYVDHGDRWGHLKIKRRSRFEQLGIKMGEYVPNTRFRMVYADNPRGYFDGDNGVPFAMNGLGLRGPEVTPQKPPGTYRVLGIGDSFTLGAGVRDEHTFLRRLESSLNARGPGRFEVLNSGVEGYNTRDEVIYLERQWLALEPDLVLIGFYLNDAYSDEAFAATIRGLDLGLGLEQADGLAQHSLVWDYAQHRYRTRQLQERIERYYQAAYFTQPRRFLESPGQGRVDWTASRAALARAVEIARERHIKIALVVFPEFIRLDRGYPFGEIHKLVMETCASLSLPALDLLEVYRGRPADKLWVHPTDHHPNDEAHRLAATAIEDFLRARVLKD